MNCKKIAIGAAFVAFLAGDFIPAAAQRIAIFDFSSTTPIDRKRQPKPFPPNTNLDGRCGGILVNPPLSVSLISLDKTEFAYGDKFIFRLRLANVGNTPIEVPTTLSLANIEPEDSALSYSYAPMEIWLHLIDADQHTLHVLLITLYSSSDKPGTYIELRPQQWVEIGGKATLEAIDSEARRVFSGYGTHSDMPIPKENISDVKTTVSFWKGDLLYFDAKTQYEYVGCHGYEMNTTIFGEKLTLVPSKTR